MMKTDTNKNVDKKDYRIKWYHNDGTLCFANVLFKGRTENGLFRFKSIACGWIYYITCNGEFVIDDRGYKYMSHDSNVTLVDFLRRDDPVWEYDYDYLCEENAMDEVAL